MKPGVEARKAAARTVGLVMRSGAFSNRLVDASRLDGADGALFRFLTYTTLRHLKRVDSLIEMHSAKKISALEMVSELNRIGGQLPRRCTVGRLLTPSSIPRSSL